MNLTSMVFFTIFSCHPLNNGTGQPICREVYADEMRLDQCNDAVELGIMVDIWSRVHPQDVDRLSAPPSPFARCMEHSEVK